MRNSLLKYKSINLNNIDTVDDYDEDNMNLNINSVNNENVDYDNDISNNIIHDDLGNDDIESSTSVHSILRKDIQLTSDSNRRINTTHNNKYINKKKIINNNIITNKKQHWLSTICHLNDNYPNYINLYLLLYLLLLIIIIILIIIIYTSNQYNYHQLNHDLSIYQHSRSNNSNSSNHCGDIRSSTITTAIGIDNYLILSGSKNDPFYILVDKQQQQQVSSGRSLYCYLSSSLLNQEGTGASILMIEQLTTGLGKVIASHHMK